MAGVLCCRLAPNVPSNQSFRPGIIIPLSLYLQGRETQSAEVSVGGGVYAPIAFSERIGLGKKNKHVRVAADAEEQ